MSVLSKSAKWLALILLVVLGGCFWEGTDDDPEFLPLDDSEYPYADLPRVVIETEDFHQIRDTETEFSARLQIYGDSTAESEVYRLTVRGRGNSSAKMPKYGLKLEFENKVEMFGMPKNRDWVMIANYGDKTHLRNYMMTRLSEWLGATYTPRMQFVELYLNRQYMGLYLFSESIKVAKHRVNIAENDTTFLIEKEDENKVDDPYVTSSVGYMFHVKSPKNLTQESIDLLEDHLSNFENYLYHWNSEKPEEIATWVDIDKFLLYYWVQEFSDNEDGGFARSTFMTWQKGNPICFGPLWDFDLAFGNASLKKHRNPEIWFIRTQHWYKFMLKNKLMANAAGIYWNDHRQTFHDLIDSVPVYREMISKALKNEYKRWPILSNKENWALKEPFDSYDEAVQSMVDWMESRYKWICKQIPDE